MQGNRILKHTQAGELVERIPDDGVAGGGNLQFRNLEAIAVYPVTGRVYVADTQNHRIKALDADLGFIRHLPVNGVEAGIENHQFNLPRGIAVHPVTGRVYVADTDNHRIKVLDADLTFIRHLPVNGVEAGIENHQFNLPRGIAVHPVTGRVYVADTDNHRIKVLDADLNFIRHFGPYYGIENNQFDRPHGISLAMVGNNVQMRVTIRHNNQQRTQVFTVDDMNIVYDRTIWDGGNGQRQIRLPTSVAVYPGPTGLHRVVYVSENGKDCVSKYSIDGDFIGLLNFGPLPFRNPHGITVNDTGTVYVCDTGNDRVQKFKA